MDESISEKMIERIEALADKLLEITMNTEDISPDAAISALAHVASMIAIEIEMPEEAFKYCMVESYRVMAEAENNKEVH